MMPVPCLCPISIELESSKSAASLKRGTFLPGTILGEARLWGLRVFLGAPRLARARELPVVNSNMVGPMGDRLLLAETELSLWSLYVHMCIHIQTHMGSTAPPHGHFLHKTQGQAFLIGQVRCAHGHAWAQQSLGGGCCSGLLWPCSLASEEKSSNPHPFPDG